MNPSDMPDLPSSVWPPPPSNSPEVEEHVNTSGKKGGLPPEIAALKWNWGAFFMPFLWTINHRMPWGWSILLVTLLSRLLPGAGSGIFTLVYYGICIYLGLKGHRLGWQHRRFSGDLAQYFEVQRVWMAAGLIIFVASCLFQLAQIGNRLHTR